MHAVKCRACKIELPHNPISGVCNKCGTHISFEYEKIWKFDETQRSIWRYRSFLPLFHHENIVTLGEGGTPLIKSRFEGGPMIYLKDETRNPTGSMKDRAMSVAYSKAREMNITSSVMISAGGAGIAAAAYASRAGIRNVVLVPPGVNPGRLIAMQIYGSELIEIQGSIEECIHVARDLVENFGWYETSTYKQANPYTSEGPKTIAYEIFEQLGYVPDYVLVPVGGGGTLAGIWHGFCDLKECEVISKLPKLIAVQNTKFNGLEIAMKNGYTTDKELREIEIDSTVETVTGALRHSYVPDGVEALQAIRGSNGKVVTVTDEEAMESQKLIASNDGIFVEPGSSTTLSALLKMTKSGELSTNDTVVLLLTGSGYRETNLTAQYHGKEPKKISPEACIQYLTKGLKSSI